MQLNSNIKLIRELSGKKQDDFAKLIKTNLSNLKTYENTDVKPKAIVLAAIAKFAGISIEDLKNKVLVPEDLTLQVDKDEFSRENEQALANDSLQSLSKAILVISESNKGLVDQHQSIIEANRVIANTNQVLAQKIINEPVRTNGDEGSVAVATSIIPTVLDLMAEIGIGHLWQTKAEGIAEIGRRLNVPSVVKRKDDHNVSGAGRKRTV